MNVPKIVPMLNEIGNVVKNQYTFYHEGNHYFQSYDRYVIKVDESGDVFLDEQSWDASKTTAKYRNMFLNMGTSEIRNQIDSGEIQVVNLNG